VPAVFAPIVLNEILAHTDPPLTDAIELYNPTDANVNVGNWYLTDDFDVPRKFRIPNPKWIPPHGYAKFTEADFNATPGLPESFVLNSEGDDVWLFSSDAASVLTGYVDGFDFGATENAVSVGRHVNSIGDVDYPAQVGVTLFETNAGPLVGPVVISEIMYHPQPDASSNTPGSYIELANLAATNTPLCHPTEFTNTWRLRNAVDFDFPTNSWMSALGRLLVVGFDPMTNSSALAAFRALYSVSDLVPIYGPWQGKLSNTGETLELKKPDAWGTNGVPYVMVEKVRYSDQAPWPEIADGAGASLQRRILSSYANEPTNWYASTPTAGVPNQPNTLPTVQLAAPFDGATYQMPTNVTLLASASDSDGIVQRVEFLADGQKIGQGLAAPFSYVWTNLTPGTHSLVARAVDDRLGTAESAPVSITVIARPPTVTLTAPTERTLVLAGTSLPLAAAVQAGDGSIDRVVFYAGNLLLSELLAPPYTNTWSSLTPGTFALKAVVSDSWGLRATSAVVMVAFTSGTNIAETVVAKGSTWKYLDDGCVLGTNWVALSFDDAQWKSGPAELGYGDKSQGYPEATEITSGTNGTRAITYYFRSRFSVADATSVRDLAVSLQRDDGAIVYLNGTNVFRSNMPDDPVGYLTNAANVVSGVEETNYFQQPVTSLLREGTNVLAVEVHQSSADSSDVSFDLALTGTRVLLSPAIFAHPVSRKISAGQTISFSVEAAGSTPLYYSWQLNGEPVPNGTSATLVVTDATAADLGDYRVLVTNSLGALLSGVASLSFSNMPPVTGNDGLLVPQGQSAAIALSVLLANDSDPELGSLAVSSVGPASDAGASVSRLGDQVTYLPVPGFAGADAFSYTVTDNAAQSAQGRVEVLVYTGSLPGPGRLSISPAGMAYRLRYCGPPGKRIQLQRSANLPAWDMLLETVVPAHGIIDHLESTPPETGAYYRVRQL
jgi:hypothetical protein